MYDNNISKAILVLDCDGLTSVFLAGIIFYPLLLLPTSHYYNVL
jgi:hypothetical protein